MSIRTTFDCDRCTARDTAQSKTFAVRVKNYTDAAGDRDTEMLQFELCGDCQGLLLGKLLAEACDYNDDWLKYIKTIVPKARQLK